MGNALSFLAFRGLGLLAKASISRLLSQMYKFIFAFSRGVGGRVFSGDMVTAKEPGVQPIISTNKRHYAALVWD